MLTLTNKAQEQLQEVMEGGLLESARLRVFVDHRCHCGKAHFSLALEESEQPGDTPFDVSGIPFIADSGTVPELPLVEIDYTETPWTKGFTIRNVDHQCGPHMMQ
jgi:Fe-S cluster assembly iron-binding protein IscA